MFLVRDIMYCKPGMARPIVKKFQELAKHGKKKGMGPMRVMTDVSGERYWTVVSEMEVENLEAHTEMTRKVMQDKDLQAIMKDYHEMVNGGRREIFQIEK